MPPHYQPLVTKCDLDTTSRWFQEVSFDIYTPKVRPEEGNVSMTFNIIGQALIKIRIEGMCEPYITYQRTVTTINHTYFCYQYCQIKVSEF